MASHYYTIYDDRTDTVLATGTAVECAKQLAMTLKSFYSMVSRFNKNKVKKYSVVIESKKDYEEETDNEEI